MTNSLQDLFIKPISDVFQAFSQNQHETTIAISNTYQGTLHQFDMIYKFGMIYINRGSIRGLQRAGWSFIVYVTATDTSAQNAGTRPNPNLVTDMWTRLEWLFCMTESPAL